MKTILLYSFLLVCFISSCQLGHKEDVILTISIGDNPTIDTILISDYEDYDNYVFMTRNEHGYFCDTFQLKSGLYDIDFDTEYVTVYLEEGYNLNITIDDFGMFDETIKAEGNGEKANNYMFKQYLDKEKQLDHDKLLNINPEETQVKLEAFFTNEINKMQQQNLEPHVTELLSEKLEDDLEQIEMIHNYDYEFKQLTDTIKIAPQFSAKDIYGKENLLSDFKGSLVYIDVWASWCKPCIAEAPYFKQLKSDFANENIRFLSVSMDCPDEIDEWKEALKTHQLQGLQLIADDCFNSSLAKDYYISSIPRFILIGKSGEVIDIDAPRPSEDEIKDLIQLHLN